MRRLRNCIPRGDFGTGGEFADLKAEMLDQFEHVEKQFSINHDRIREIASEIAVIHRRIERLEEQGASNAECAREIDHALERIAAIEKHLGLDRKIAAWSMISKSGARFSGKIILCQQAGAG